MFSIKVVQLTSRTTWIKLAAIEPDELNGLICSWYLNNSHRLLIKQIPLISCTCKQHQLTLHLHFYAISYKSRSENVLQHSLSNNDVTLYKENNFSWLSFVCTALRCISLNRQVIILLNYVFGTFLCAMQEIKLYIKEYFYIPLKKQKN